jgi:hypothetical protein
MGPMDPQIIYEKALKYHLLPQVYRLDNWEQKLDKGKAAA